jgi:hypothetical protein
VTILEFIRRLFGSFLKFLLGRLSLKPRLIDDVYLSISNSINRKKRSEMLVDPDPSMFMHVELKATSNVVMYQYFVIIAHRA